jgi:hypothetical protein
MGVSTLSVPDFLLWGLLYIMSRPKKATVDYFPHYVNQGKTMFTIESKYGNDGYAFWFKILELLGATEHHYLDCNDTQVWEYLLAKTRLNEQIALDILTTCAKLNAIDFDLWSIKVIRSNNFILNLDDVYKRRDIDVISNTEIMDLCKQKYPLNGVIVDIKPQSKVNNSKPNKTKENNTEENEIFELWYSEYPKKEAKQDAIKAWNKLQKSMPELSVMVDKLKKQIKVHNWTKENIKFIPLPASYLNGKRWEDEVEDIKPVKRDYMSEYEPVN